MLKSSRPHRPCSIELPSLEKAAEHPTLVIIALTDVIATWFDSNFPYFQQALRPFDVKDILDRFAATHVEIFERIKDVKKR